MNSYPKLFYILKEINLFDKTNLVDELNSILKQKNVTKPEIIDYFKKPYLKWFVSPTDDQEKQHYVKKHHVSSGDPEWAKNTFDFNHLSNEHKEELAHTIDFFNQLNERDLKKIHKIPFPTVRELVKKWDQELSKRMSSEIHHFKIGKDVEILKQWPNGYKIVQILSNDARKEEGDIMGHCVGGDNYENAVILSLRDEHAMPHVTMELNREHVVYQIKGKQNAAPVDKYVPYIREFIDENNLNIRGDGENIGFIEWGNNYFDPDSDKWETIYKTEIIPYQNSQLATIKDQVENPFKHIVSLVRCYFKELPRWIKDIDLSNKSFNISYNLLTTLETCPDYIGRNLYASDNKLTTLKGSPSFIKNELVLRNNLITSLEGCPDCGELTIPGNKLTSVKELENLKRLSKMENLDISRNEITSLDGLKNYSGALRALYNKITTLVGGPERTKGAYYLDNNLLTNLVGSPKRVGWFFSVDENHLVSLEGCPEEVFKDFYCSNQKSGVVFKKEDILKICKIGGLIYT